jgi:allantoate deiminase
MRRFCIIGSHIDSVHDGGRYDGPLGVMLGIELVARLNAAGRHLPFAIEVIGFGDEEGSRFPASMLTSRAVAGTLEASAASDGGSGWGYGAGRSSRHATRFMQRMAQASRVQAARGRSIS